MSVSEDDVADINASLNRTSDYNREVMELRKFRAQCEADGKDPFEMLAHVVAHNYAVDEGTRRGKGKKPSAEKRRIEIAEQLREHRGSALAVAIDRQTLGKGSSLSACYAESRGQKAAKG